MSAEYGDSVYYHNIATESLSDRLDLKQDDDVLILIPVYGGRLPSLASENLMHLNGNGQRTVVCVVYGNRDYDDALLELCEIAKSHGFNVVAASAFIAEHCIFPKVAAGRPDGFDLDIAKRFINTAWRKDKPIELTQIKGNHPYKKIAKVPLHPVTDYRVCKKCGTCARECPYNAIDSETFRTDPARCSACGRCLHVCERDARKFKGLMYNLFNKIFTYQNRDAKEPDIFI
ncbi:MAG: 4Fe-4S binding protein [Duncaniella sp.]|nr:4Fe-4S binding protein [Duncaniella sp.]